MQSASASAYRPSRACLDVIFRGQDKQQIKRCRQCQCTELAPLILATGCPLISTTQPCSGERKKCSRCNLARCAIACVTVLRQQLDVLLGVLGAYAGKALSMAFLHLRKNLLLGYRAPWQKLLQ
jgi:hypothetical protein